MALIPINDNLNKSEDIADYLLVTINEDRPSFTPRPTMPQIMMTKTRQGLSSEILTAAIVSRFKEAGIPSGPLVNGQKNVMEAYTEIIVEEIISAIQSDMRIDVVVDPGMMVQSNGANAAGPVPSVGTSIKPHTGIAQAS